jgi:hypothetical protein
MYGKKQIFWKVPLKLHNIKDVCIFAYKINIGFFKILLHVKQFNISTTKKKKYFENKWAPNGFDF